LKLHEKSFAEEIVFDISGNLRTRDETLKIGDRLRARYCIMDRSQTLIDVKLALAAKYERRAKLTSSRPRQSTLAHQALKYRRQAEQLQRPQK